MLGVSTAVMAKKNIPMAWAIAIEMVLSLWNIARRLELDV